MQNYYTITEISKKINVPESTVRYYRDRFPEYMDYIGQGRSKRYTEKTIKVLRIVAEENIRNATTEEIKMRLDTEFMRVIDVTEITNATEKQTATPTATEQQQTENSLSNAIMLMNTNFLNAITALNSQEYQKQQSIIAEQSKEIESLKHEMKSIKDLVQNTIQQQNHNKIPEKKTLFSFLRWNKTTVN